MSSLTVTPLSTALGAQIKYAQLQCLCRMADYAAALAK